MITACSSNMGEEIKYEILENSKIVIQDEEQMTYTIEPGNFTVFCYRYVAEDEEDIADDEFTESLVLEIDPNLSAFDFNSEELKSSTCIISNECFCTWRGYGYVEDGKIQGNKNSDGTWNLIVDIKTPARFSFSHKFE